MQKNLPFLNRLKFALHGLRLSWNGESSFRTHVVIALLTVLTAALVRPAPAWWALLAVIIGMVISAELFNTAIERLSDHVQPEFHDEIKAIKDIAAAAVLITALVAVAVAAIFIAEAFLRCCP